MTRSNSVELLDGVTEDEFSLLAAAPGEKITLKLKVEGLVHAVTGAFQE